MSIPLDPELSSVFKPRAPGIDRQQGEVDFDAGLLLEFRRHFLHQGPVPGTIVADINQLFRLALRQRGHRQHRRGVPANMSRRFIP